jgi:hypothetical protein
VKAAETKSLIVIPEINATAETTSGGEVAGAAMTDIGTVIVTENVTATQVTDGATEVVGSGTGIEIETEAIETEETGTETASCLPHRAIKVSSFDFYYVVDFLFCYRVVLLKLTKNLGSILLLSS